MTTKSIDTAREIVSIVPIVMRIVSAEVRRNPNFQEPSHVGLLRMLAHRDRCTMGAMAERMSVSLPTMSRTMRRMEQRHWVSLQRDDRDRRTVWAELTPQGRAALDEVYEQTARRVAALVGVLSPEDRQTLSDGLAVLRKLFEMAARDDHGRD